MAAHEAKIEGQISERALSDQIDLMLSRRTSPRRHDPTPDAVIRQWGPALYESGRVSRMATSCSRHPALLLPELIQYPEAKIGRTSRSAYRGIQAKFHSRKNNRTMRARALLEFKLFYLCEADPQVTGFIEQPVRIKYTAADARHRFHVPDLLIVRNHRKTFVEVKREFDASTHANEERWRDIGPAFAALGYEYEVLTERYIEREPRATTVKALFRARRSEPQSIELLSNVAEVFLRRKGAVSIGTLLQAYPQISIKEIYYLILRGHLVTDLDLELSVSSIIWPGGYQHE